MSKILALDYGTKKTGLAETDVSQTFAFPLKTIPTHTLIDFVTDFVKREQVACLVVGKPLQMDGQPSSIEPHIKGFIKKIKKTFPKLLVERADERFTSKIAKQSILDAGLSKKKRRDKTLVDTVSAVLILQDYLAKKGG